MPTPSSHILFVDDDPGNLQVLQTVFSKHHIVHIANGAAEALLQLQAHPIKVIISDHRMPLVTGMELLEQVAAKYPEVVRIMLTAFGDLELVTQALNQAHLYQFLFKPVNINQLKMVLESAIQQYDLQEENKQLLRHLAEANQNLEQKVVERTQELQQKNQLLLNISQEVNAKNEKIAQSLNYAKKLQAAILQPPAKLEGFFPESFLLSRPKDIVSGDFFWFRQYGHLLLLVMADCTGHGIPGAFMTILGNIALEQAVAAEEDFSPKALLESVDERLQGYLRQPADQGSAIHQEGMDMVVLAIDYELGKLLYSNAKMPAYLVRPGQEPVTLKGSKHAIGLQLREKDKAYEDQSLPFRPGDMLYLASDGFQDQHSQARQKFQKKRFVELLGEAAGMPANEQRKHLVKMHEAWKGHASQTDDITVLGIRL